MGFEKLGLLNTKWAAVLWGALALYNLYKAIDVGPVRILRWALLLHLLLAALLATAAWIAWKNAGQGEVDPEDDA